MQRRENKPNNRGKAKIFAVNREYFRQIENLF